MKRRKRPRLMPGDYCSAEAAGETLKAAFLAAVEEAAPEVVVDLRESVLPPYATYRRHGSPDNYETQQEALQAWAGRWNIKYSWVLAHARATLGLWLKFPDLAEYGWGQYYSGGGGFPFTEDEASLLVVAAGTYPDDAPWPHVWVSRRLLVERTSVTTSESVTLEYDNQGWLVEVRIGTLGRGPDGMLGQITPAKPAHTIQGWDPTWEPREVARARLVAAVDDYLDDLELSASERGLSKVPDKRTPAHFQWLAKRVCLRQSCARIAADTHYTLRKVQQATNRLARELGLIVPGAVRGWAARRD